MTILTIERVSILATLLEIFVEIFLSNMRKLSSVVLFCLRTDKPTIRRNLTFSQSRHRSVTYLPVKITDRERLPEEDEILKQLDGDNSF
mmetsp:Transcript_2326/g.4990  ORF Transcript_2326/g.4990 Transcript_2326/m.4990 type:complete len:89 (-) Transcript_2326:2234-2500(-)